jgi:hypothetical protein
MPVAGMLGSLALGADIYTRNRDIARYTTDYDRVTGIRNYGLMRGKLAKGET